METKKPVTPEALEALHKRAVTAGDIRTAAICRRAFGRLLPSAFNSPEEATVVKAVLITFSPAEAMAEVVRILEGDKP